MCSNGASGLNTSLKIFPLLVHIDDAVSNPGSQGTLINYHFMPFFKYMHKNLLLSIHPFYIHIYSHLRVTGVFSSSGVVVIFFILLLLSNVHWMLTLSAWSSYKARSLSRHQFRLALWHISHVQYLGYSLATSKSAGFSSSKPLSSVFC